MGEGERVEKRSKRREDGGGGGFKSFKNFSKY
jgi:hypothetical protein